MHDAARVARAIARVARAAGWTGVGLGVAYQQVSTGPAMLVAYGGYTARLPHVAAWASALIDSRLGAAGVGHVYAVQGPRDAAYAGREIANTKLRAHLAAIDDGVSPIYLVAHSRHSSARSRRDALA